MIKHKQTIGLNYIFTCKNMFGAGVDKLVSNLEPVSVGREDAGSLQGTLSCQ